VIPQRRRVRRFSFAHPLPHNRDTYNLQSRAPTLCDHHYVPEFRPATPADISALLPLMRDFYSYERLPFDAANSERLLNELIADPGLGRLIIFEDAGALIGYMVLTFGYSLEYGGRDALIDEFYVLPAQRAQGLGTQAIQHAIALCRELRITNIHLEADYFNARVHEFYKRLGFRDHERHFMTLTI
jgi:GNAT superfamily N-acetyltransferase